MFTVDQKVSYKVGAATYFGKVLRATPKKVLIQEYDASGELDGRFRYFTGRADGTLRLRDVPTHKAAILQSEEK